VFRGFKNKNRQSAQHGLPVNQTPAQNQIWAIALSSAAMSGVMLASVSSPMLEMRNVLPLIFP
jgi:hypothetical protein